MGQVQSRLDVLRFQLEQLLVGAYGRARAGPLGQLIGFLQTPLGGAGVARWELRVGRSQESRVCGQDSRSQEPSEISVLYGRGLRRQSPVKTATFTR